MALEYGKDLGGAPQGENRDDNNARFVVQPIDDNNKELTTIFKQFTTASDTLNKNIVGLGTTISTSSQENTTPNSNANNDMINGINLKNTVTDTIKASLNENLSQLHPNKNANITPTVSNNVTTSLQNNQNKDYTTSLTHPPTLVQNATSSQENTTPNSNANNDIINGINFKNTVTDTIKDSFNENLSQLQPNTNTNITPTVSNNVTTSLQNNQNEDYNNSLTHPPTLVQNATPKITPTLVENSNSLTHPTVVEDATPKAGTDATGITTDPSETIKKMNDSVSAIGTLISSVENYWKKFDDFIKALTPNVQTTPEGKPAQPILTTGNPIWDKVLTTLAAGGGGALTGWKVGGPWGALLGGIVGIGIELVGSYLTNNKVGAVEAIGGATAGALGAGISSRLGAGAAGAAGVGGVTAAEGGATVAGGAAAGAAKTGLAGTAITGLGLGAGAGLGSTIWETAMKATGKTVDYIVNQAKILAKLFLDMDQSGSDLVKHFGGMRQDIDPIVTQSMQIANQWALGGDYSKVFLVSLEEVKKAAFATGEEFGSISLNQGQMNAEIAQQAKIFGIEAGELVRFNRILVGIGAEFAKDNKNTTAIERNIKSISINAGISYKIITRDIAKNTELIAIYGKQNLESIIKAAAEARKLGINLDTIAKVQQGFSTFDQAIEKTASLNALLGTNLDAMKLFSFAATGDIKGMQDELNKVFDTGKKLNGMEIQQMIQVTGLTGEQIRKMESRRQISNDIMQHSQEELESLKHQAASYDTIKATMASIGVETKDYESTIGNALIDVTELGRQQGVLGKNQDFKDLQNLLTAKPAEMKEEDYKNKLEAIKKAYNLAPEIDMTKPGEAMAAIINSKIKSLGEVDKKGVDVATQQLQEQTSMRESIDNIATNVRLWFLQSVAKDVKKTKGGSLEKVSEFLFTGVEGVADNVASTLGKALEGMGIADENIQKILEGVATGIKKGISTAVRTSTSAMKDTQAPGVATPTPTAAATPTPTADATPTPTAAATPQDALLRGSDLKYMVDKNNNKINVNRNDLIAMSTLFKPSDFESKSGGEVTYGNYPENTISMKSQNKMMSNVNGALQQIKKQQTEWQSNSNVNGALQQIEKQQAQQNVSQDENNQQQENTQDYNKLCDDIQSLITNIKSLTTGFADVLKSPLRLDIDGKVLANTTLENIVALGGGQ